MQNISYFDSLTPWKNAGDHFLIRGFALNEEMQPAIVRHGEKKEYPWPWLIIFFNGPAWLNIGSPEEKEYEHSMMIWPPGVSHCYGNPDKNWIHSWIILDDPDMESALLGYPLKIGEPILIDAEKLFERYLTLLYEDILQNGSDPHFQKKIIRLFLYELHRLTRKQEPVIPQRIQEIKLYLMNNYAKELTIESIAKHFEISPSLLSMSFREHYHIAPIAYVISLRMNQAARLLRFYPYTCKEIAELVGFQDPLYFSRKFRKYWGMSPKEYRVHAIQIPPQG